MKVFHCKALLVINCFLIILAEGDFYDTVIKGKTISGFCGKRRVHHSLINPIHNFNTTNLPYFYILKIIYIYILTADQKLKHSQSVYLVVVALKWCASKTGYHL